MLNMFELNQQEKRYERQLTHVEHLILKETGLSKSKLREVCEALYQYRVID